MNSQPVGVCYKIICSQHDTLGKKIHFCFIFIQEKRERQKAEDELLSNQENDNHTPWIL